jgi:hypothetical protein
MKMFFVFFVSLLAVSAAAPQSGKKPVPQASKTAAKAEPKADSKPAPSAKPAGSLPEGAVQGPNGEYRYTDPQGKKWLYRKTPFGVTRREDIADAAIAPGAGASIKATEEGDKVRFERQTPFGIQKWEKKKSELDESEKAALQSAQTSNNTVSKQD